MSRTTRAWLLCILATSLVLNLWGINFGLPEGWHPDEIVGRAVDMARNFTLNPHEFRYGSLHFYQVLAVIVPTYLVTDLLALPEATQKTAVYLAARALSAVLGTGCVVLTFLAARQLFNQVAGLISAVLLTLTMGFVNIAHFATTDVPMLFWILSSFLMSTHVLRTGARKSYVLGGVFAGFAAASKYPGGLILLSLFAAHFLYEGRRIHSFLFYGIFASFVSFLVVNPSIFFASCEFMEGFIKDNTYATVWESGQDNISFQVIENVFRATGLAIFTMMLFSFGYSIFLYYQNTYRSSILLLTSAFVPFFIVLSSTNATTMRFTVPLIPPLLILAGKLIADLISSERAMLRRSGQALFVLVSIDSGLYTVAANLEITNDSRKMAATWIQRNVPSGSRVEATTYSVDWPRGPHYGAAVQKEGLELEFRPHTHSAQLADWVAGLQEAPIYRALYPAFLRYASLAEGIGICDGDRPYYEGWYERQLGAMRAAEASFDQTIDGLEWRAPDYVVASSFYYDRFDTTSPEGQFFAKLLSGASSYRPVAEFQYSALPFSRLDPEPEFFNPQIYIFQRSNPPSRSGADQM